MEHGRILDEYKPFSYQAKGYGKKSGLTQSVDIHIWDHEQELMLMGEMAKV